MHNLHRRQEDNVGKNFWTSAKYITNIKITFWTVTFYYDWTQPTPASKTWQHRPPMSGAANKQCVQGNDKVEKVEYMPG